MRGRTLRIFVMGESPLGLRQVELDNWTGAAVMGTRDELGDARELPELESPAVYLLADTIDGQSEVRRVYVGETEDFRERGVERNERIADWEHFIAFYSKDENLTKAHVRWLERELYARLQEATGRVIAVNGNNPPGAALPRADEAAMATYLDNTLYVLTALGLDFFSPRSSSASASAPLPNPPVPSTEIVAQGDERYVMGAVSGTEAKATAVRRGRAWIVLPGSKLAASNTGSLSVGYKALREELVRRGILQPTSDGFLTARQEIEFSSPSAAAAVVRGYATNGKWEWRRESDNKRFSEVLADAD